MMHPDFFNLIGKAGAIYTIVSTNGHFLTEENAEKLALSNLSKLIVSLDGMSAHTYSIYRKGGDFDTVIRGIEIISSAIKKRNSDLKLEIQFLVSRYNEGEIEKAKEFADKVNAQFKLKSMQIINKEEIGEWQPENKKYRRYKPENGKFRISSTLSNRCFRLWTNPVVTWDGKVVPCCFDKDASHIMGDLNISTFREIWNGEKYMEFRRSLLQGREKLDICNNCTTGLQGVKY
jgi:radical SAM protein with 4Fe4S-binding SPASM domain